MKALSVLHNGKPVCTAGGDDISVLGATVSVAQVDGNGDTFLGLAVSGISLKSRVVYWPVPTLSMGDEVTIRLNEVDQGDPPQQVSEADAGAG
jgi:hypothetical protein